MSRPRFSHLLFLRGQCIRGGRESRTPKCSAPRLSLFVQKGAAEMPRYLSQHTIACLTRQGAEELAARLHAASAVRTLRVLLCMQDGKLLVEFEAASREELEKWLAAEKFHFDWILRVEYESREGKLAPV